MAQSTVVKKPTTPLFVTISFHVADKTYVTMTNILLKHPIIKSECDSFDRIILQRIFQNGVHWYDFAHPLDKEAMVSIAKLNHSGEEMEWKQNIVKIYLCFLDRHPELNHSFVE